MNKRPFPSLTRALNWGALEIAGAYLILGSLWILFSDRTAARLAPNADVLAAIGLYKDWGFVLVTAFLLFALVQRHSARMRASEMQLKRILDALPALISYIDKDQRYLFTNSAYQDWFGGETLGRHIQEVVGVPTYQAALKYVEKVLKGETVQYETEILLPHGERFISAIYVPDISVNGQVEGFFTLVHDVTEQKQVREEQQLWADAFEGCAHGIAVGDPNINRIVVCNPAFAKLHKSRVEDIVGTAILSLYAPSDHEHVRRNVEKADQIGHARFEAQMVSRGGDRSSFMVQMDVVSVFGEDGEVLHRVFTAQDISERKVMDEKLKESETKYRTLAEHIPAITYISQPDQYIGVSYISPRIESLGFNADAWLADPELWWRHIHPDDKERVSAELQKLEDGAESFRAEYRLILPNGESRWFRDESIRVKDENGKTLLKQGFMLDITDRKQAESILEESKERYRIVSELTSDYAYKDRVDPDGSIVPEWVTDSFTRITGFSMEEAVEPEFWKRLVHPGDLPLLSEHTRMIVSGQADTREFRVVTKTGQLRWLRDYANPIWDPDEQRVTGLYGAVQDITEYKQVQEKILVQARWLEQVNDAVISSDQDRFITSWNPAAEHIYGWKADEVIGKKGEDVLQTEFFSTTRAEALQGLRETGKFSAEITQVRKDGSKVFIETRTVALYDENGQITGYVSANRDISERKRTEEALRLKDELLRLTSEMAKVGGWEFDAETGKGTWTDEVARIHDLDPAVETNVEVGLTFYAGDSRHKVERAVQEAVELGKPYDLELEMVTAKGNRKWVRTMGLPIVLNDKVSKVQGIFQDITERKQIEQALQEAQAELEAKVQERTAALSEANALLQALMDNIPDHIYFKDRQSRFIRNSRSQASLLGLSDPSEAIGKTDFDFFPHASQSFADEQKVMETGEPHVDFEEWVVWPDGREMWVTTTKMPLRNTTGETIGIFGISHDITERKRAEQAIRQLNADLEKQTEQLQAANKELEAFSYSVSHDLRAPLRAIDGYTRILVEDYEAILDSEGKRVCGVISREARRMGRLIDDLLAFSRLGRKEMYASKIEMKTLVVSVLNELMKEENPERINIKIGKLPVARGDSSLIRQVWVNLISNALKFTSKKERAEIEIGSKTTREEFIYYVRDNGAGFDMEYANKLFGVFQRLHGESEFSGTGVGLAIVQRIIRRHDGHVWAEGEVEKGATFYFALPRKANLE